MSNKKIYNNHKKFELTVSDFKIVVNEVEQANPDIKITIQQSNRKNSKSLYAFINYNGTKSLFRISDHRCKGSVRQIIIKDKTTITTVCNELQVSIERLKIRHLHKLLEKINKR